MAEYNYDLAKKTIQKYSDLLDSASMGMAEDWGWTAVEVYEDSRFKVNLDESPDIAGISGSHWATPTLLLVFKDGSEKWLDCYIGDTNYESKPSWFELGCLSQPIQDAVDVSRGKFIN